MPGKHYIVKIGTMENDKFTVYNVKQASSLASARKTGHRHSTEQHAVTIQCLWCKRPMEYMYRKKSQYGAEHKEHFYNF